MIPGPHCLHILWGLPLECAWCWAVIGQMHTCIHRWIFKINAEQMALLSTYNNWNTTHRHFMVNMQTGRRKHVGYRTRKQQLRVFNKSRWARDYSVHMLRVRLPNLTSDVATKWLHHKIRQNELSTSFLFSLYWSPVSLLYRFYGFLAITIGWISGINKLHSLQRRNNFQFQVTLFPNKQALSCFISSHARWWHI